MHGMFEKAWQVLRLSPQFTMFNLTWNNEGASPSCKGVQWHEETAFPRGLFGEVSGPGGSMGGSYYTNKELWEKFDPYGDDIPYVYANFTEWGEWMSISWRRDSYTWTHSRTDTRAQANATGILSRRWNRPKVMCLLW